MLNELEFQTERLHREDKPNKKLSHATKERSKKHRKMS